MAKQSRVSRTRVTTKSSKTTKTTSSKTTRTASSKRKPEKKPVRKTAPERPRRSVAAKVSPVEPPRQKEAQPAPPPRKPAFYEAIALYERGVQALQRHNYPAAAEHFRIVIDRYPDERELVERARLYLRVCERETSRQPATPTTPEERVYAATVSLNSGDHDAALSHLNRALDDDPESDHAHYIMAVALSMRGRPDTALDHLRQAIALNPENRSLARQDPDLDGLRNHESFRSVLDTPADGTRRRPRARR
jgi:tetratricopeptide (TPR) repeat protein